MTMRPRTASEMTALAFSSLRSLGAVSDEVARDLGIAPVDDIPEVVTNALQNQEAWASASKAEKKEAAAPYVGAFTCGDCISEVKPGQSCGHISVDLDGARHILG